MRNRKILDTNFQRPIKCGLAGMFIGGCFWLSAPLASAQMALDMAFLEQAPAMDGVINETEWLGAVVIDQPFIQFEPEFGRASSYRTIVRVGQTDTALYIAFEAFDPDASRLAAAVTRRDGGLAADDSVAVALDTFGDGRTAYLFQTNSLATQEDARIADNGRTVDRRWDTQWRSAAMRYVDRWTVEFEIPFSILKYSAESKRDWGVNFVRTTPRRFETSLWSGPGETIWRVSSFSALKRIKPPAQEIDPWMAIPYALANYELGEDPEFDVGIDARWRPSSRLGVDLTYNPDFALVEADIEEINLTRFALRVPEKRPFFLEGNEMFNQRLTQFYSRRIGDVAYGAKASGKLGNSDFSAIITSEDRPLTDGLGEKQAYYGIARFQKSLVRGSNVGLLVANRNLGSDNAGSIGIDTTMFFTNTLGMTGQLMQVYGPVSGGGLAWFLRPSFDSATSHFHVRYQELDEGILENINTVGFLVDDNRKEVDANLSHIFWIENGRLEKVHPMVNYNRYWSQDGVLRGWMLNAQVEVVFRKGWVFMIERVEEYKLFEKEFRNDRTVITAGWDGRNGRSISVYAGSGFNFDSDLTLYGVEARWPFGDRWRFAYDLTRLELNPDPKGENTWIHVFEMQYSFNPDNFVKLFVQTNSSIDKENIQALWVWRFKPPFGSVQLAYQRGTSMQGQRSQQGDTFFTKLSWVF